MADYRIAHWQAGEETGLPARDRRSGAFNTYVPDALGYRPLVVGPALSKRVAEVERAIRTLGSGPSGADLEGLSRFLLRSEAVASYLATEVLNLIDVTERQLASTAFDTRTTPPNRPVPAPRQT